MCSKFRLTSVQAVVWPGSFLLLTVIVLSAGVTLKALGW
jgi:hypothetical protein